MSFVDAYGTILLAAVLGGASAGLLGVLVIGLRMPFLAVCTAHAAMAGAVFGHLAGVRHDVAGFLGALAAALALGHLLRRHNLDPNAALGTLFSLMMGLAFLGIGLGEGPRSELFGLLWGSLLFVSHAQLMLMAAVGTALVVFVTAFGPELKLLLFSRELASILIPEGAVFGGLLVLAAATVSVNLDTVGGLMLYSLICNPAVASLRLARSFNGALGLGATLGALSAVGGFLGAWWFDLPVGACIVLFSSLVVGVVLWTSDR